MTAAESTAIIVFARAPQPGHVKTRLIPLIGAEGAAALHVRLLKLTLETARAAGFRRIELHGAPDCDDPFFRFCAGYYGVTLVPQATGDLGARMLAAFEAALAVHARVLLVGSDCPILTARHLRRAERALREGTDAVLAPCEDGGYALIGLRRVHASLFDNVPWGSGTVMAETRGRIAALEWRHHELETLWDVDRAEDYQRLVAAGLLREAPAAPRPVRGT